MTIHSFFIKNISTVDDRIFIEKKENSNIFHQVINVLRLKINSIIYLLDNCGNRFESKIIEITKKNMSLQIIRNEYMENDLSIHLWIPYIKLSRLETCIEFGVQMGVDTFHIFESKFAEKKNTEIIKKKEERLLNIIKEGSEQSERFYLAKLIFEDNFFESYNKDEYYFFAIERNKIEGNNNDNSIIKNIVVGPEGGWSIEELEKIKKDPKFKALDLSYTNILRTETAAIAMLNYAVFKNSRKI